jgi:iron complex transport system permease protein
VTEQSSTWVVAPPPLRTVRRPAHVSRVGVIAVLLLGAMVSIGIAALASGITQIPPQDVLTILLTEGGERVPRIVIWEVRMPRFVLGALAGAALAVSGAMLQDALKNELAEPGLLGVSTGASLVVAVVVILNVSVPLGTLPFFALLGGLGAGLVILLATRLTRDPVRMILIGAALGALFGALITVVVVLGEPEELRALYSFLVGSLIGSDWQDVRLVLPWIAVALPIALFFGRPLNLLQLGDDMAEGLGLRVFRTRALIFTVAIALNAAIVAVCGPIAFVALVAPHMVRGLLQTSDARQVLPISALLGALMLTGSDLLARELFSPAELPVGLITVVIGSPIALFLLRRLLQERRS